MPICQASGAVVMHGTRRMLILYFYFMGHEDMGLLQNVSARG